MCDAFCDIKRKVTYEGGSIVAILLRIIVRYVTLRERNACNRRASVVLGLLNVKLNAIVPYLFAHREKGNNSSRVKLA